MTMPVEHVAAIRANRHRRPWKLPRPRTADGFSKLLAILLAVGTPVWFIVSQWWNPSYDPQAGWVWAVPGYIAIYYITTQLLLLFTSAGGRSERIGMDDTIVSGIAFTSVFATTVVILMLALDGRYHLGAFQWTMLMFLLKAALFEFLATGWVRFLVNRRYFATAQAGSYDDGGHHE